MRLLAMAWRNLQRNRQRTLLAALTVLFGVLCCVVLQGLSNAFVSSLIAVKVEAKLGAVHVFRRGYFAADDPLRMSLPWDPALVARIRQIPGVTAVAPRIEFDGLLSNGAEGTMFQATAIDPSLEYQVCPKRRQQVAPGSLPLVSDRASDVLIGKTLADALLADRGATLVMQASGPHASTNALDVEIRGFLPTIDAVESRRVALVDLKLAQDLLRMPQQVTSYVIGIADLQQAKSIAASLRRALGEGYEVTTWAELDPGTKTRVLTAEYAFFLVALMLFVLAAAGIVNIMLMAVYERVREIGTMLSLGTRRSQITILFLWEAGLLGVLAATVGAALGSALVYLLGQRGIVGPMAGGDPMILHPWVSIEFVAAAVACAGIGAIGAGLYPAWQAARLRPVEALHSL